MAAVSKMSAPKAMRYQANGAKVWEATKRNNQRTHTQAESHENNSHNHYSNINTDAFGAY